MALNLTFSEPTTVNTAGAFLAAGMIYDSGHTTWVYLGFRIPTNVLSCQTSTTGASGTWTMRTMPSSSTWRAIDYASTLGSAGRLVAVGNGVAAWSDDGGATWAAATVLPEANNWIDVKWWPSKSLWIAVSANGVNRAMSSTDGKTWVAVAAASALVWSGLAVSTTTAVAVAFLSGSTSTQLVMTTTDGATWTLQTHTAIETRRGLVSSGQRLSVGYNATADMFIITGNDGSNGTRAWRSTDSGVTWTASNAIPTIGDTTNRGHFWLASASSWYMSCANFNYCESTDGITWTQTTLSTSHGGYTPMGFLNSPPTLLGGTTLGFDTVLMGVIKSFDSLTPAVGTKYGGTVVTLTGVGFTGVTSVTFGGTAAVNVVVVSDTRITCITPAHVIGLFDVVVVGVGTLTNAFSFVSVDRVSPKRGTVAGATAVTITGFGFDAATGVLFDDVAATDVVLVSNTSITATTPAHASGLVDVTVSGVETGTSLYTYTLPVPQDQGKGPLLPPIPTSRHA